MRIGIIERKYALVPLTAPVPTAWGDKIRSENTFAKLSLLHTAQPYSPLQPIIHVAQMLPQILGCQGRTRAPMVPIVSKRHKQLYSALTCPHKKIYRGKVKTKFDSGVYSPILLAT